MTSGTDIHAAKQPADPDAAERAKGRGPATMRAVSRLSRKAARRRSRRLRRPASLPRDGGRARLAVCVQPVAVAQPGVDVLVALGDPLDGEQAGAFEFVTATGPGVVGQLVARSAVAEHVAGADPARCAAAGIPDGTAFAAKPALARVMIGRALDAGTPAGWVAGDEVHGADPGLRADLERRQIGYVLAVATTCQVTTGAGACQAGTLATRLPRCAWQQYSAGHGAKGYRCCDWAGWPSTPAGPATAGC